VISGRKRFPLACAVLAGVIWLTFAAAPGFAVPHPHHDDLGLIPWRSSWSAAIQEARVTGKPLFIELSRNACPAGAAFAGYTLANSTTARLLRRHFVCVAFDMDKKPAEVEAMCKAKNLKNTPVCLFMTVAGVYLEASQANLPSVEFDPFLRRIIADPRIAADPKKEKDLERLAQELAQALTARDARRIQETWQSLERIPGSSPAKSRAYEHLDQVEAPAWDKIAEAARLVRHHKYPLARVALEEAAKLSEALPLARNVTNSLAALPFLEEAAAVEKAKPAKWKEKVLAEYQKVLAKHADASMATAAQLRLRALLKAQ
jgi:hypothetical protein